MLKHSTAAAEPLVARWKPYFPLQVLSTSVTILQVTGNVSLLLFMYRANRNVIKNNLLILSLTLSDLFDGMTMPMYTYVTYYDVSQMFCELFLHTSQAFGRISTISILAVTFERYLKLWYPLKYRTSWNRTRYRLLVIAIVWTYGMLLSVLRFIDSQYNGYYIIKGCLLREHYTIFEQVDMLINMSVVNIVAIVFYIKICQIVGARRTKVRLDAQKNCTELESIKSPGSVVRKHAGKYSFDDIVMPSWRPVIRLGLIIGLNFFFISLPATVYTVKLVYPDSISDTLFQSTVWFYWLSTAVDPVIFAFFNSDYQNFLLSFGKITPIMSSRKSSKSSIVAATMRASSNPLLEQKMNEKEKL